MGDIAQLPVNKGVNSTDTLPVSMGDIAQLPVNEKADGERTPYSVSMGDIAQLPVNWTRPEEVMSTVSMGDIAQLPVNWMPLVVRRW